MLNRSMMDLLRREEASRRMAAENLKVCPLCGGLNAATNAECFVCCWRGEFSYDPYEIEDGVVELMAQCPELVDAFVPPMPQRRGLKQRVRDFLSRRRARKQLDLWA